MEKSGWLSTNNLEQLKTARGILFCADQERYLNSLLEKSEQELRFEIAKARCSPIMTLVKSLVRLADHGVSGPCAGYGREVERLAGSLPHAGLAAARGRYGVVLPQWLFGV